MIKKTMNQTMNNNIIVNCDTDSFSCCKPDGSAWTKEEISKFTEYINSHFPKSIVWANDGLYKKVLVIKSKNYVLLSYPNEKYPESKITIKGSAFKDAKKPKIFKELIKEIID